MRTILTALLVVGLAAGGAVYYWHHIAVDHTPNYRTAQVKRGDLLITIGATGTLEPEEVVDVGAQVAGRILELGKDPRGDSDPAFKDRTVDYCSPVHKSMLLAQIDTSLYQATRDSAAASLAHDQADLLELAAKRDQTEAEWKRAQRLRELNFTNLTALTSAGSTPTKAAPPKAAGAVKETASTKTVEPPVTIKGISDSDYILAKANFEVAAAYLEEGKASVEQDKATLSLAETNLRYTRIISPVEGTIIDRRVNIGQTVVASLNAPSMFLIARDLRQMQVWSAVNEADIGRLKIGTPVKFTVDAFPEDEFRGEVFQIRLNATSTQNVVTYIVVVNTKNDDLKLLPYLTADVKFEVDRRDGVLLVPNGALRWQPQTQQIHPDIRDSLLAQLAKDDKDSKGSGSDRSRSGRGGEGKPSDQAKPDAGAKPDEAAKDADAAKDGPVAQDSVAKDNSVAKDKDGKDVDGKDKDGKDAKVAKDGKPPRAHKKRDHRGQIWVKDGDYVRPVDVRIGATDSTSTEVSGSALKENMEIVLGEIRNDRPADTTNPFAPKLFRGKSTPSVAPGGSPKAGAK